MSLPPEAETDNRLRRAFMARIARLVLPESGHIDRRDGLVLMRHGLLRMNPGAENRPEASELASTFEEPAEATRGPLMFYRQSDGQRAVVSLTNLLLDERADVRAVALRHLSRVRDQGLCAPSTGAALSEALSSSDGADEMSWIPAAVALVDAVEKDWALHVAAVRQTADPDVQELWGEHLTAALHPQPGAVNECSMPVILPSLQGDRARARSEALRKGPTDLGALVRVYVDELGHVPLGGGGRLGGVLETRLTADGAEAFARSLSTIGQSGPSVIVRYHLCEAQLGLGEGREVTAECAEAFWECVLAAPAEGVGTLGQEQWRLLAQLARYFVHTLETSMPTDHGEGLTTMAWWMAMRLGDALTGSPEELRSHSEQIEGHAGGTAAVVWDLLRPRMSPSELRYLTTHGPSPWALGLVCSVSSTAQAGALLRGAGPGAASERLKALITLAVLAGPVRTEAADGLYRFNGPFRESLRFFAELDEATELRETLQGVANPDDETLRASPDDLLRDIEAKEEHAQGWHCHVIRARACAGSLSPEALWKALTSATRAEAVFAALAPTAAQALAEALIELAVREPVEWRAQVPHLLASAAERRAERDPGLETLFACTVRACTALRMGSAMTRLLRGPKGHRFRARCVQLRSNLERVLPHTSGWVAGRLRQCLEDLTV